MRKLTYFAVYELSSDGGYGVYFPDLPGCISHGATYEEAEKMAKKALGLHVYQMEKDDDVLPSSSEPSQLAIDQETTAGYIISPVTVFPDMVKNDMDNRAVKTTLTIPAWLKEIAEINNVNFSQLLQAALKEYLKIEANR